MTTQDISIKCKLCDHVDESGQLIDHLKEAHTDIVPKDYIIEHGKDAIIHPIVFAKIEANKAKKAKGTKSKAKKPVSGFEFKNVTLPKAREVSEEFQKFIPSIDENYQFQDFTECVILDLIADNNIALTGHTGSGKTSLVEQLAARVGQPTIRVNTNQQTTTYDFMGYNTAVNGSVEWVDGALPFCMKNGFWLVIDEGDYAEPSILSALNAVLEEGRTLMLKEKGNETIKAHEDFRIIFTGNTLGQMSVYRGLYQGTRLMNEAFMNRFNSCYIVDYLDAESELKMLLGRYPTFHQAVAKRMVAVANAMRESFKNETIDSTFSPRLLMSWTQRIMELSDRGEKAVMDAAKHTIESKLSAEDAEAFRGMCQRHRLVSN